MPVDFPEAVNVGGLYGINVETLGAAKTLTPGTDEIYQYLDEGGANRVVNLDTVTAVAGDRFVIRHNGSFDDDKYLEIKENALMIDDIYAGNVKGYIFDGTNWIPFVPGSGERGTKQKNVGLGYLSDPHNEGTALGSAAEGYTDGAAVGKGALGYTWGVGIGHGARGFNKAVAVGFGADTNNKQLSLALGHRSETIRSAETSVNMRDESTQANNVVQGRWVGDTTDAAPIEIFLGRINLERFTIRPDSVLAFTMLIVARDDVANEVARYSIHDGLIKRDGANNTVMVLCTVTVDHEDDGAWDVAVTADDGNEALIITVTGDPVNPTKWAAVLDGVEIHF